MQIAHEVEPCRMLFYKNKKFEPMLTRRAKACSSSGFVV